MFWLRYTVGEEQVRRPLNTSDPLEATKRAEDLRGQPLVSPKTGKTVGGKTELERRLEKYMAEKLNDGTFVSTSAGAAELAVKHFAADMAITDPSRITTDLLKTYYMRLNGTVPKVKGQTLPKRKSEATAQTYVARVGTFARWAGMRVETPKFVTEAPSRKTVIPWARVDELLAIATGEMKFILLCGFRAGMRRGEITAARPEWFDLDSNLIHIPAFDRLTGFSPKSGNGRTIPLAKQFAAFIKSEYSDWDTRKFVLRPEVEQGKWRYRFDFRNMFEAFAKTNCPKLTAHVMRHSYASHLANGGIGIAQLSAWTGDKIATLEKHYLHPDAEAEKAEAAFAGETTQSVLIRHMAELLAAHQRPSEERTKSGELISEAVHKELQQTPPPKAWFETSPLAELVAELMPHLDSDDERMKYYREFLKWNERCCLEIEFDEKRRDSVMLGTPCPAVEITEKMVMDRVAGTLKKHLETGVPDSEAMGELFRRWNVATHKSQPPA
jgi:integrase